MYIDLNRIKPAFRFLRRFLIANRRVKNYTFNMNTCKDSREYFRRNFMNLVPGIYDCRIVLHKVGLRWWKKPKLFLGRGIFPYIIIGILVFWNIVNRKCKINFPKSGWNHYSDPSMGPIHVLSSIATKAIIFYKSHFWKPT